MGILINGVWKDEWYDTKSTGGRFVRWESRFRNWITADGMAGPSGEAGFRAEPGKEGVLLQAASAYEAASKRRIPPPAFPPLAVEQRAHSD